MSIFFQKCAYALSFTCVLCKDIMGMQHTLLCKLWLRCYNCGLFTINFGHQLAAMAMGCIRSDQLKQAQCHDELSLATNIQCGECGCGGRVPAID